MFPMNMRGIIQSLANQDLIVGLVLAGAGLVFVLLGVRIYKALVVISLGTFGFFFGASLPVDAPIQLLTGIVAAGSFGLIGARFARVGVAVLGGSWAAIIMAGLLGQFGIQDRVIWAIAILAFAVAISLTFIVFAEMAAFVTSLEGALLITGAIIVFFSNNAAYWAHIRGLLLESFFGPFLVLAGTVTGYYLQMADWRQKTSGGG